MITFFTSPKPFYGKFAVIQRNAIKSWKILHPNVEVILFDDTKEGEKIAEEIGLILIKEMKKNKYGTPLLNYLFEKAQEIAKNRIMCYINADIILMKDFLDAVKIVSKNSKFMLVGRRWDIDLDKEIDFSDGWEKKLKAEVLKKGQLHGEGGIDYFVFPRNLIKEMPPFAVGRCSFDGWLIYNARKKGIPVIDATEFVMVIHQNHDYSHVKSPGFSGKFDFKMDNEEYQTNLKLAGKGAYFTLRDANYILTQKGIKRDLSITKLHRNIDVLHWLYPYLAPLKVIVKAYINILKKIGIRRTI